MRSIKGRTLAGAAVAGALVLGGAGWAYAAGGDASPNYRVATVGSDDVEQTISLSGTLERSSSSELAFGASGTVSKVTVGVGDKVKRGQVLAKLDTTELKASVSSAEAKVANAKATLASDKQAQVDAAEAEDDADAAAAAAKASAAKAKKQAAAAAKKQAAAAAAAAAKLRQQQEAVTSAQTSATKALTAASSALAAQQTACTTAFTLTDPSDASSVDATATAACTDALDAVSDAQSTAQKAQQALQKALATLTASLGGSSSSGSGSGSQSSSQGGSSGGSSSSGSNASASGSSGAGGREVTAATLASDQASIDQAEADLITAQQDLDGAVLTAPTAGTIGAWSIAKGDSASSGTSVGTLLGSGTVTLTIGVSATQAAELAAGQVAEVLPAGAEEKLDAHVTRVSHVASSDSSGSSTYPVLITLDAKNLTLPNGGTAAVDVVVGTATDVLTVPTSAVSSGTVTVLKNGTTTRTKVTTGLVGASRTQITDGLEAGEEVVLADVDAELPTSSTSTTNSRSGFGGGGGGFGGNSGGGFSGGGFGGAR